MKVNKVFKAFVIVIAIINVLFATGTFAQASVLETGNNCLRASMQIRTHVRINTYSRSKAAIMRKGETKADIQLQCKSEREKGQMDKQQQGYSNGQKWKTYS